MDHALVVWWVAIETGFAQEPEWVAWADQQILRLEAPPLWILDLSLVHTQIEALGVLEKGWSSLRVLPDFRGKIEWFEDLWLGFLYLAFERGRDLLGLLLRAGGRADGHVNSRGIPCETFYLLANEIDGGGPTEPSDRPLMDRTMELFAPAAEIARREWSNIWDGLDDASEYGASHVVC